MSNKTTSFQNYCIVEHLMQHPEWSCHAFLPRCVSIQLAWRPSPGFKFWLSTVALVSSNTQEMMKLWMMIHRTGILVSSNTREMMDMWMMIHRTGWRICAWWICVIKHKTRWWNCGWWYIGLGGAIMHGEMKQNAAEPFFHALQGAFICLRCCQSGMPSCGSQCVHAACSHASHLGSCLLRLSGMCQKCTPLPCLSYMNLAASLPSHHQTLSTCKGLVCSWGLWCLTL